MAGFAARAKPIVNRLDRWQQRHWWAAVPVAVVRKFGEDRASNLAALVAYYSFFSLFPLLLILVTLLGFALGDDPAAQERILDSALAQFPVVGDQLRENVGGLSGSGVALAIGIGAALWASLGAAMAMQQAMNSIWPVPKRKRPNFLEVRLRALLFLAVLGAGIAGSTTLSTIGAIATIPVVGRVPVLIGAAVIWVVLQAVGSLYVTRIVSGASHVYGTFAVVLGLLSWLHLEAQLTMFCAELNVVLHHGLWPRSLLEQPAGDPGAGTAS
jgi:uncharacterized BrkB/YihY/UPF0761 family membrane protein